MRISVLGLGYVGTVSAACLASAGHEVIGVDTNPVKVDPLNAGSSPIIEAGIDELIARTHREGRLSATGDAASAIQATELSLVCVGTPSASNGSLDLRHVQNVCHDIGVALRQRTGFHCVVIRSTVLPGTMRSVIIPALESASGRRAGEDFGICFNPEFLREGTAVADYLHPPKTVIGQVDDLTAERLLEVYAGVDAPLFRTSLEVAEMIKYVDNTWHALKVGFANEVGSICKASAIDGSEVMNVFCQDSKLNLSAYYLKPGFAFGGSCLPKDVRALRYRARALDVETPILNAILRSNEAHVQRGVDLVLRQRKKRVAVLGFSFKAGTDDLRESPIVELVERLIGKGCDVMLYDRNVSLARLTGANRDYILNHIPHIANLMRDRIEPVLAHAEVVVIGNADPEFRDALATLRSDQTVVDLVRVGEPSVRNAHYEGICW